MTLGSRGRRGDKVVNRRSELCVNTRDSFSFGERSASLKVRFTQSLEAIDAL